MIKNLEVLLDNFDLKIIVHKRGSGITMAIIPTLKAGKTDSKLAPISLSGDADFIDASLKDIQATILQTQSQRMYNIQAFTKSLEKAEEEVKKTASSKSKTTSAPVATKSEPKAVKPEPQAEVLPLLEAVAESKQEPVVQQEEPKAVAIAPAPVPAPVEEVEEIASLLDL